MPLDRNPNRCDCIRKRTQRLSVSTTRQDRSFTRRRTKYRAADSSTFLPEGILAYLHQIERGEPVDAARTREALIAFNDRQWQISSALGGLQFDRLAKQLKLNISTVAALDRVRDEKSGLRKEIQDEINYYGRRGVRIDKLRIRRLIAAIQSLNKSIEQVDLLINSRARAH